MTTIALFLVLIFAGFVLRTYWWQFDTKRNGMEAEAFVSWIEKEVGYSRGQQYTWYRYYVRFVNEDGLETELKLLNPKKRLVTGSKVRIRYTPKRNKYAVLTEILAV